MIQLRVHAADDPKESWLEVDGHRVAGTRVVVATDHASEDLLTFSVTAARNAGIEIVFEESESRI